MPRLPVISGRQAVTAFSRAGWKMVRQKGSHIILVKSGLPVTLSVPDHKELDVGTLRKLIRLARLTVEEFNELLD